MRLASLPAESAWAHSALRPRLAEPARQPSVPVLDDPDAIDAFFARQAGS